MPSFTNGNLQFFKTYRNSWTLKTSVRCWALDAGRCTSGAGFWVLDTVVGLTSSPEQFLKIAFFSPFCLYRKDALGTRLLAGPEQN